MAGETTRINMVTATWDNFKDELRKLYLVDDYTLEKVMTTMIQRHRFIATLKQQSKAQYEIQFKKWRFRKNLTKDQWGVVAREVQKRKRREKDSNVYIDGLLLDPKKVHKATSRYGSMRVTDEQAIPPDMIAGIRILTPPPMPLTSMSTMTPSQSMPSLSPPVVLFCLPPSFGSNFAAIKTSVPSALLRSMFDTQGSFTSGHTSDVQPLANQSTFEEVLVKHFDRQMRGSAIKNSLRHHLKALIPDKVLLDRSVTVTSAESPVISTDSAITSVSDYIVYMISNNLSSGDAEIYEQIYGQVESHQRTGFLKNLVLCLGATAEVLMERLLPISIRRADVGMVKALIEAGLDPNYTRCHAEFDPCMDRLIFDTPLGLACKLRKVEVVRELLNAGADVNYSLYDVEHPLTNAIEHYHDWHDTHKVDYNYVDMDLVRLLLDRGADPSLGKNTPLLVATRNGDVELVSALLLAGANPNLIGMRLDNLPYDDISVSPLQSAISGTGSVSKVMEIVRLLLQAGARIRSPSIERDKVRKFVQCAAHDSSADLTKVVQAFIDGQGQVSRYALISAAECGELDTLEFLLTMNDQIRAGDAEPVSQDDGHNDDDDHDNQLCDHTSNEGLNDGAFFLAMERADELVVRGRRIPYDDPSELRDALDDIIEEGDFLTLRSLLDVESKWQSDILNCLDINSLFLAISSGHDAIVEVLLDIGVEINVSEASLRSGRTRTPLLLAIQKEFFQIARRIIAAGADVNMDPVGQPKDRFRTEECICSFHRASLLPAAVVGSDQRLIEDLINAGAELNAPGPEDGRTALTVAVERGDLATVQLLLDAGADVNASAGELLGCSALAAAIRNHNTVLSQYLLSLGAVLTEQCVVAAIPHGIELMYMLLNTESGKRQGTRPGFGSRALQRAILLSDAVMIEFLLSQGIDPNVRVVPQFGQCTHRQCFCCPHMDWHDEMNGIEREHYERSAFGVAIDYDRSNNLWIVGTLLKHGADPNGTLFNPPAVHRQQHDLRTEVSFEQPNWSRPKNNLNVTPLLAAVEHGNLQLVEMLIEAGADVNLELRTRIRRTPLQLAAEMGDVDIVEELLRQGADVNAPPFRQYGATALQFAAIKGYLTIVSILLSNKANINAPPAIIEGRTALEGACEHGRVDIVQLLLQNGALLVGPGKRQYERARSYAADNGHMAIQRHLDSCHAIQSDPSFVWNLAATVAGQQEAQSL